MDSYPWLCRAFSVSKTVIAKIQSPNSNNYVHLPSVKAHIPYTSTKQVHTIDIVSESIRNEDCHCHMVILKMRSVFLEDARLRPKMKLKANKRN